MAGREGAEVGWVGKAQEFALYSKGNGKSLKAMLLSKPSEEDFSGCCVDRELVDGRLGSGKCLEGGGRGTKVVAQIRGTIKGRGKGCEFIYEDRSRCQGCGRDR